MPISHREQMPLTCPQCRSEFHADLWLILDAQEQPEQVAALRQNHLNVIICPTCGFTGLAGTPLIYHNSAARQVIFAPPSDTEEYIWRERARELHTLLVGSIPPEARRAYLGDVQIAQDIAGIAHILNKANRRPAAGPPPGKPIPLPAHPPDQEIPSTVERVPEPSAVPGGATAEPSQAQLMEAIQVLLTTDSLEELDTLVKQYPVLLTDMAGEALEQLADVAVDDREYAVAENLHRVRLMLARLRTDSTAVAAGVLTAIPPAAPVAVEAAPAQAFVPPATHAPVDLSDELCQALLSVESSEQLAYMVEQHPVLLQPGADTTLSELVNQVLDEGDESLAYTLEQRREALSELRQQMISAEPAPAAVPDVPPSTTEEAIEAFFVTATSEDNEETLAQVIADYPVLLTDEAQAALWELSATARAQGDEDMAVYAVECRAMLRQLRARLTDDQQ